MTDVSGDLLDVAGFRADGTISARSLAVREGESPTDIVTTAWHDFPFTNGDILMEGLDPGPAEIMVRTWNFHEKWRVEIPDSDSEVTLWPLLDSGVPPRSPNSGFIRSNTLTREDVYTQDGYAALPSPDPTTKYVIIEKEG